MWQKGSMGFEYGDDGHCRCKALRGTLMENVSCEIYENRPSVCMKFEKGGKRCLEIRERKFVGV